MKDLGTLEHLNSILESEKRHLGTPVAHLSPINSVPVEIMPLQRLIHFYAPVFAALE